MAKETEISKELKKLQKIFENIQPDKKALCESLLQNAAFMAVKLRELQDLIDHDGMVEDYDNGGGQSGIRENPWVTAYEKLLTTFNKTLATLNQIGDGAGGEETERLDDLRKRFKVM